MTLNVSNVGNNVVNYVASTLIATLLNVKVDTEKTKIFNKSGSISETVVNQNIVIYK